MATAITTNQSAASRRKRGAAGDTKMPDKIEILKRTFDAKQIEQITADLTKQYGEYGRRYTTEQVSNALWKSLQTLVDMYMFDLELISVTDHDFETNLGEPEFWNDPNVEPCAVCDHPRGEHTPDGCEFFYGEAPPYNTCQCTTFTPKLENGIDPETLERAKTIYRAHEGNLSLYDCIMIAI